MRLSHACPLKPIPPISGDSLSLSIPPSPSNFRPPNLLWNFVPPILMLGLHDRMGNCHGRRDHRIGSRNYRVGKLRSRRCLDSEPPECLSACRAGRLGRFRCRWMAWWPVSCFSRTAGNPNVPVKKKPTLAQRYTVRLELRTRRH
jgi:hypothetical protein